MKDIEQLELKVKQAEAALTLVPSSNRRRHIENLLNLEKLKLDLDKARLESEMKGNADVLAEITEIQRRLAQLRNINAKHLSAISQMKARHRDRTRRIDSLLRQLDN